MEYKHRIGQEGHKIEDNPKVVSKRLKKVICNEFNERVRDNSLCKDCK